MTTNNEIAKGLEGIEVDETAISFVNGTLGTLSYRGYPIDTLVNWPFTRVALLVLDDQEPDEVTLTAFEDELTEHATLRPTEVALLDLLAPTSAHPMQVLIALAVILEHDPRAFTRYGEAARGLSIAARLPAALAYLLAKRRGSTLSAAQTSSRNPVARYLNDIGTPSHPVLARAMEVTQILQIEHGFNAGTFAARVVASTLAPIENSIAGAFATLHGTLHGGADQAALETAYKVGSPEAAAAFVDDCLTSGNRVMGMGHREYKVLDPRARYVKQFAMELSPGTPLENVAATLVAIEARFTERMREKNRPLYANLEFYKGIVYSAAGLPPEFFTATFAMARVFGYIAHFMESRKDNRIIRPSARYVGRMPASV